MKLSKNPKPIKGTEFANDTGDKQKIIITIGYLLQRNRSFLLKIKPKDRQPKNLIVLTKLPHSLGLKSFIIFKTSHFHVVTY